MGRKSLYDTEIKPYIADIRKAVEAGATVKEIASAFGINKSTLYKYKAENEELKDAFARGREKIIFDIKGALLKKALGYEYNEKKQYITEDSGGNTKSHTEILTRHMPPSETACAMLLRNYDKNWLDKDNTSTQLRQQELKLKTAIAESSHFDLEID